MAMQQKITIKEYWGQRDGNGKEKFKYEFFVDNHDQLGWIVEKIIELLNSNEWRKIKRSKIKKQDDHT